MYSYCTDESLLSLKLEKPSLKILCFTSELKEIVATVLKIRFDSQFKTKSIVIYHCNDNDYCSKRLKKRLVA